MATAVLDVDLSDPPQQITGLDRYNHALILIRWQGRPVGQTTLAVENGCIEDARLREAAINAADSIIRELRLHEYLGLQQRTDTDAVRPKVTVAVCTRDRTEDLQRCLEGLMQLPDDGQELIVVDNHPATDATYRLVQEFGRVRYVREDRPGLDVARNRALREAQHEIVAFVDDDAVPDSGWLRALLSNFNDPLVMCVTGLTMPLEIETEAQEWFQRHSPFGRGFRRVVYDNRSLSPGYSGRVGAGANMALRRSVIEQIGFFDEALDAGTLTHSGGDNEYFARILGAGFRIVYDPAALVWHRHRRTWEELRRALYGYGVGVYAAWTRGLVREHELGVLKVAWSWFSQSQFPALVRSLLRRPGSLPLDLILAELRGCVVGPWAYFVSRKRLETGRES